MIAHIKAAAVLIGLVGLAALILAFPSISVPVMGVLFGVSWAVAVYIILVEFFE